MHLSASCLPNNPLFYTLKVLPHSGLDIYCTWGHQGSAYSCVDPKPHVWCPHRSARPVGMWKVSTFVKTWWILAVYLKEKESCLAFTHLCRLTVKEMNVGLFLFRALADEQEQRREMFLCFGVTAQNGFESVLLQLVLNESVVIMQKNKTRSAVSQRASDNSCMLDFFFPEGNEQAFEIWGEMSFSSKTLARVIYFWTLTWAHVVLLSPGFQCPVEE